MGLVKLENGETVKDRRINGSRLRLDIFDWVKISITIFTTFAVIIFGAGKLMTTVNANSKTIEEHSAKFSVIERDIGGIKVDVSYIRGWIEKVK